MISRVMHALSTSQHEFAVVHAGMIISRTMVVGLGIKPGKKFKADLIGYVHIDIAEIWTKDGKLSMFVVIDQVSKFAFTELHQQASRRIAADVLRRMIKIVPYFTRLTPCSPTAQRGRCASTACTSPNKEARAFSDHIGLYPAVTR
jgi:hypothetical protein